MKTSIVGRISKRYLVATVAAIIVVAGVGATSIRSAETDKDRIVSAEQMASVESVKEAEDSSTPDSVTTDDSAVNVDIPLLESETESAVLRAPEKSVKAVSEFAKTAKENNVDDSKLDTSETSIQKKDEVYVPLTAETTEEFVEDFGEDEKEITESEIVDESSTGDEDSDNSEGNEKSVSYELVSSESPYSNHLTKFKGVSYFTDEYGVTHRETYYDLYMGGVVSNMRYNGFSEEEYPYWIDEIRGTKMLGPYIMIAANQNYYPLGSIVDTDMGLGIVADTGGFSYTYTDGYDIATNWDNNWYPGYNC